MRIIGLIIGWSLVWISSVFIVYGIGVTISPDDPSEREINFFMTLFFVFWWGLGYYIIKKCKKKKVETEEVQQPVRRPVQQPEKQAQPNRVEEPAQPNFDNADEEFRNLIGKNN